MRAMAALTAFKSSWSSLLGIHLAGVGGLSCFASTATGMITRSRGNGAGGAHRRCETLVAPGCGIEGEVKRASATMPVIVSGADNENEYAAHVLVSCKHVQECARW